MASSSKPTPTPTSTSLNRSDRHPDQILDERDAHAQSDLLLKCLLFAYKPLNSIDKIFSNRFCWLLLRIRHELHSMMLEPVPGCTAAPRDDSNLYEWISTIEGPVNSPYAGGTFLLDIIFGEDYPFHPPKVKFRTRIYHCNINRKGDICVDILKSNWSAALTLSQLLLTIVTLMGECNPEDPLEPEIAKQYLRDRQAHDKIASDWTKRFASIVI